jgi:hypothetical protein
MKFEIELKPEEVRGANAHAVTPLKYDLSQMPHKTSLTQNKVRAVRLSVYNHAHITCVDPLSVYATSRYIAS